MSHEEYSTVRIKDDFGFPSRNKELVMKGSWALVAVAMAVVILSSNLTAGGKKSDSEVKVTATAKKDAQGNEVVTVNLEINKGWHVYANPVGNEDLAPAQTTVTVNSKTKPKEVKVVYPDG